GSGEGVALVFGAVDVWVGDGVPVDVDQGPGPVPEELGRGPPGAEVGLAVVGVVVVLRPVDLVACLLQGVPQDPPHLVDVPRPLGLGAAGGDVGLIAVGVVDADHPVGPLGQAQELGQGGQERRGAAGLGPDLGGTWN